MSLRALTSVWESSTQEGGPLLVMLALADNATDQMVAYPSVPMIARKSRLSERQVRRVLRDLEAVGEIKVVGTRGNNVKEYLLTPSLAGAKIDGEKPGQNVMACDVEPGQIDRASPDTKPGQIDRASPDTKPGHIVRADMDVRACPDIAMSAKPSKEEDIVVCAREALDLDRDTLDRMERDLTTAVGKAFAGLSFAIHDMTHPIVWLQRGDDWSLDVLATVKLVADASLARDGPGKINSWKYFDRAIATARKRRTSPPTEAANAKSANYRSATDRRLDATLAGIFGSDSSAGDV